MYCVKCGKRIGESRTAWIQAQVGRAWPKCGDCGKPEAGKPEGYPTPHAIARMKFEAARDAMGVLMRDDISLPREKIVADACNYGDALVAEHLRRLEDVDE